MKSIAEITKAIQFVVDEVHRLDSLRITDWKAVAAECGLSPGLPADHCDFPKIYFQCSREGEEKLYEIAASRIASDQNLNRRIDTETFARPLKVEISQQCLVNKKAVTPALVEELLKAAKAHATAKLANLTYFFPVFAITEDGLDEFQVGATKVTTVEAFFNRSQEEWQSSITKSQSQPVDAGGSDHYSKHVEMLYRTTGEHYRQHRWIAAVEILNAERSVGWRSARQILEHSFNVLRLLVPSRDGQFVGIADESPQMRAEAWITHNPTVGFEVSRTSNWIEPHVQPGYLEGMRNRAPQVAFVETVVKKVQNWSPLEPLESRLLASLFWFGEAWKERAPLPKLVKFAICLEGLVMTGDKEGLTELLAERIAMLCATDTTERKKLYEEVREVYRARSRAVHGDLTENDFPLGELNRKAEQLCVFGLLSCADLFPLLMPAKDPKKALADFFTLLKLGGLQEALQSVQPEPQAAERK